MSHDIDYKEIGRRIETRRKELGLTLADLAAEVDLSASTIQRYEKGRFEKIKMPVIEAIASALYVNPAWVIGYCADPIDYSDPELIASIPPSYIDACDGDVERAFKLMEVVDRDVEEEAQKKPTPENEGELAEIAELFSSLSEPQKLQAKSYLRFLKASEDTP